MDYEPDLQDLSDIDDLQDVLDYLSSEGHYWLAMRRMQHHTMFGIAYHNWARTIESVTGEDPR